MSITALGGECVRNIIDMSVCNRSKSDCGQRVSQDLFEGIQGNIDILSGLKSGDSRLYQKEVHVLSSQLAFSQLLPVPCSGASHVPRPLEPHKQWIWSAMDAKTRQVVALHVGARSRQSAKQLWAKMPEAYRQHATFYTDQCVVYEGVMPAAQDKAISKVAQKTNHSE